MVQTGLLWIETRPDKCLVQLIGLKINGNKYQMGRDIADDRAHLFLFCRLSRGMIQLEYPHAIRKLLVAHGKRIEARTENHILSDALRYRLHETVFGISGP